MKRVFFVDSYDLSSILKYFFMRSTDTLSSVGIIDSERIITVPSRVMLGNIPAPLYQIKLTVKLRYK